MSTGNDAIAHDELKKLVQIFPDEVQLQTAVLDLKDHFYAKIWRSRPVRR
jgi:hypothetical protein